MIHTCTFYFFDFSRWHYIDFIDISIILYRTKYIILKSLLCRSIKKISLKIWISHVECACLSWEAKCDTRFHRIFRIISKLSMMQIKISILEFFTRDRDNQYRYSLVWVQVFVSCVPSRCRYREHPDEPLLREVLERCREALGWLELSRVKLCEMHRRFRLYKTFFLSHFHLSGPTHRARPLRIEIC